MNILFLTSNLGTIGGIQRYNKNFVNSLEKEKENVIIIELKDATLFSKIYFSLKFFYKVLDVESVKKYFMKEIVKGHKEIDPAAITIRQIKEIKKTKSGKEN